MGAASTLINTSLSLGMGMATLTIEIVISPSLVTVDRISLEVCCDMLGFPRL
jgi:hypothetical protein